VTIHTLTLLRKDDTIASRVHLPQALLEQLLLCAAFGLKDAIAERQKLDMKTGDLKWLLSMINTTHDTVVFGN
jgi:hypothetical protein